MAGNNLLKAKILRDSNTTKGGTNALAEQFPELYGAFSGLLGTAPDEVGGSVLDGSHQAQKAGAGVGFPLGLLANILPSAAPAINKTAAFLGKAAEPTVNAFVARTMANGGKPAQLLQDMARGTTSQMFIGPKAKTWDAAAAKKAEEMTAQGVAPRQIWSETGTWKAPDGKWRQEIPDNEATLKSQSQSIVDYMTGPGPATYPSNLNSLIDHPQLLQAYPELQDLPVVMKNGFGGSYSIDYHGPSLEVGSKHSGGNFSNPQATKSTASHELQHVIQDKEGWAQGGSPDDAVLMPFVRKMYSENIDGFNGEGHELMKMAKVRAYENLAGEAEARATQARLGMDAAQRRATFPEDSYDVPVNQLIVRNSGAGEQMSIPVNKFVYPQDAALATAQRNAALPVEQGGLGLHPSNTPMERAQAMGFDTEAFHGTPDDRLGRSRQFKDSMLGKTTQVEDAKMGHFTVNDGNAASEYIWRDGSTDGGNVLPLQLAGDRASASLPGEWMPGRFDNVIQQSKRGGYDGLTIKGTTTLGKPGDYQVTFDPKNIRSRFAAFDPMRRDSPDILAGLLPLSMADEENRNQLRGLLGY